MAAPGEVGEDGAAVETGVEAEAGRIRDVSDELTQFAPFETSKSISSSYLPYRGERTKPPQVEINDGSYLGQPKVLFRKLRSAGVPTGGGPGDYSGASLQPEGEVGEGVRRRVRVRVVGERSGEGGGERRRGRLLDSDSGQVTKSLVLNRIGTLGKDQVQSETFTGQFYYLLTV